ncbi:MAG: regulator of sigma protease [Gaiellaceae bacterium]|jgi:regulator of sigma E protease|nr:regulator of sigma protease [Gaiellaceae bacterium]
MGVIAAIVGLALLVMIHEAGHFFAARAVGMTPRKFYLGFGPAIAKTTRGGVEYGVGSIPLGGYVKIPGMNRPSPGDLRRLLPPADAEQHDEELRVVDEAIERGDYDRAHELLLELRPALGETRGWQELEGSLARDAYWRAATWRRLTAIFAGPAVNLVFAIALFTALFVVSVTRETNVIGKVVSGTPAAAAHLRAGDRVLGIDGRTVPPKEIPAHIRATHGRPFKLLIDRHGRRVVVGLRAQPVQGAYRIGIAIESRQGPGESVPAAMRDAVQLTWRITADTVRGIAHLATGRDTNQVSSSVGIVKVSAAAWREGLRTFLFVLGLISLALGLLNLLPVLPLDGGHMVMALVEKARGRTFAQGVYIRYSVVGLTLFALLMYFGLRNDTRGWFG